MLNLQFSWLHLILVTQVPRDRDSKSQIFIIAFLTKMVVLTILANSNDHTVCSGELLGKSKYSDL